MERSGIFKLSELLVDRLQLVLGLCFLVLGDLCGFQELLLNEEIILLAQLVEELGQIGALLRRNLCCGSIGGSSTVPKGEDATRAKNAKVFVNDQTAAIILHRGELSNQVPCQWSESVPLVLANIIGIVRWKNGTKGTHSSPNDHSTRNFFDALIRHLEGDALLLNFLHHRLGHDFNLGFLEGRFGILDEGFAERRQYGWESFNKRNLHPVGEFWVPEFEIFLQEIVKFTTAKVKVVNFPQRDGRTRKPT